jgi:His-Xaa-Ser system protein HxsD
MKEIVSEIKDGKAYIRFTKEFYEKEAVLNAAYKMTDKYSVMIKPVGDHEMSVTLEPKTQQSIEEIESAASDFCNEVIDQQLRLDLEKRFGKIRELIVEHAFSPLADHKSRLAQIK